MSFSVDKPKTEGIHAAGCHVTDTQNHARPRESRHGLGVGVDPKFIHLQAI